MERGGDAWGERERGGAACGRQPDALLGGKALLIGARRRARENSCRRWRRRDLGRGRRVRSWRRRASGAVREGVVGLGAEKIGMDEVGTVGESH